MASNNTAGVEKKTIHKKITKGAKGMTTLSAFKSFTSGLNEQEQAMPVLFIGHGSPMNGIEDTEFTRRCMELLH